MRDRWDEVCQEILVEAKSAAIEMENYFLGTEHLAIAMCGEWPSRLNAILRDHGVDPGVFAEVVYRASTQERFPFSEHVELTPRIRAAVRHAEELSQSAGRSGPIAEIHLLAAVLSAGRGVFVRVLEAFRLTPDRMLAELEDELGAPAAAAEDVMVCRALRRAESGGEGDAAPDDGPSVTSAALSAQQLEAGGGTRAVPIGVNNPVLLDWGVVNRSGTTPKKKSLERLLDKLGRDVTRHVREAGTAVLGREDEIEQLQRALCRANRNNALLIGPPGVGKTAIVEGLARRVVEQHVPPALRGVRIVEVAMASLIADTHLRGQFEERMLALVEEVRTENVVLLIDDVHVLATGNSGAAAEAGNILRPFLARGDIRVIGVTSPEAFARHLERDTALVRCFHPINVEPPDDDTVRRILAAAATRLERFHGVKVPDKTLDAVIRMARAYLKGRQMPDIAIDLLDEACVKTATAAPPPPAEPASVRVEEVAAVVAQRSGIPVESLTRKERDRMAQMEDELRRQVIGQDEAVRRVSARIRMFKAGFREERRPLGVFLFLGPTGVGKTELAKALARFLFESDDAMLRFDMSEYGERHEVARLIGTPPGYVGFGEEGQLTGAVRRSPHCVVLLDEIEKAHSKVFDLFLQVFDEGRLTDGKGVTTDFTHAILVLTSNLGADLWKAEKRIGFRQEGEARSGDDTEGEERRRKRIFEALKGTFRLEFLNRLDEVILFRPLEPEEIRRIARQMVERWQVKSKEQRHPFEVDESVLDLLCSKGYDPELGARPMKRAIERYLVGPLSRHVLDGDFEPDECIHVHAEEGHLRFETAGD